MSDKLNSNQQTFEILQAKKKQSEVLVNQRTEENRSYQNYQKIYAAHSKEEQEEKNKITPEIIEFNMYWESFKNDYFYFFEEVFPKIDDSDLARRLVLEIALEADVFFVIGEDYIKIVGEYLTEEDFLKIANKDPKNFLLYFDNVESFLQNSLLVFEKSCQFYFNAIVFEKSSVEIEKTFNDLTKEFSMQKTEFLRKSFTESFARKTAIEKIARVLIAKQIRNIRKKAIKKNENPDEAEDKQIKKLLKNPALKDLAKIDLSKIPKETIIKLKLQTPLEEKTDLEVSSEEIFRANLQATICENLFIQNLKPTDENIRNEAQGILDRRERLWHKAIFRDRNVIMLANNEMKNDNKLKKLRIKLEKSEKDMEQLKDSDHIFSEASKQKIKSRNRRIKSKIQQLKNENSPIFTNKNLKQMIEFDGPLCFEIYKVNDYRELIDQDEFLQKKNTEESLKEIKKEVLEKISMTEPPLTFIFNGHGAEDALYLQDGQIDGITDLSAGSKEGLIKITVDELFASYKTRKFNPSDPDIFVLGSCFNATFIKNFYRLCECDEENVQKPIFIGESEFGQYAFGEQGESKFYQNFYDHLFKNGTATIGSAISADNLNKGSNPTVIAPDEQNRSRKLSMWQKMKKIFWG